MSAVAQMDFSVVDAAHARLERLLTRCDREDTSGLPEWAGDYHAGTGGLRAVLGVLEAEGASHRRLPLAAVLPLTETAGASRAGRAGAVQQVTLTLAVIVLAPAPNDPGGRRALHRRALDRHRAAIRAALIGWLPAPCCDAATPSPSPAGACSGWAMAASPGKTSSPRPTGSPAGASSPPPH